MLTWHIEFFNGKLRREDLDEIEKFGRVQKVYDLVRSNHEKNDVLASPIKPYRR